MVRRMGILGTPLGWIMSFIYDYVVHSYGWALILFIILTRVVLYPLGVKQQKSTARMAAFQPKLQQLQKQYAKDKNRYQEEMMKLYEQEGVSPTAGCLPMAVQMIFLFGLIDVIYKPLHHLLHISNDLLDTAAKQVLGTSTSFSQLEIVSKVQSGSTAFYPILGAENIQRIQDFDMNFLGINLGAIPNQVWGWTILIPILSFATQILYTLMSMAQQKKNGQNTMQGPMKWMMIFMPLMSLWFAFTMPAGIGLYWTVSNVLMIFQQLILQKLYPPEKVLAKKDKAAERNKEKMRKRREKLEEYNQTMAERGIETPMAKLKREQAEEAAESAKSEKKMDREAAQREKELVQKRLAEARKRMAEKYGDEYSDSDNGKDS